MKGWQKFASKQSSHASTEEKDNAVKDAFYANLEDLYDKCPAHDIKIVLVEFNAEVGQEGIFGPTVGQFSLHSTTSLNGVRLIDFAAARNMVVPGFSVATSTKSTGCLLVDQPATRLITL